MINIGPRRVDNLAFPPQIDTDLRLFIHDMIGTTFEPTMKPFVFEKNTEITGRKIGVTFKSNISLRQNVTGFSKRLKNLQHCCPNFAGVGAWYTPTIAIFNSRRREELSSKLFNEVVVDPGHTLQKLLPPKNPARYFVRRYRDFALPLCKTDRCKKSFIFSHVCSA